MRVEQKYEGFCVITAQFCSSVCFYIDLQTSVTHTDQDHLSNRILINISQLYKTKAVAKCSHYSFTNAFEIFFYYYFPFLHFKTCFTKSNVFFFMSQSY